MISSLKFVNPDALADNRDCSNLYNRTLLSEERFSGLLVLVNIIKSISFSLSLSATELCTKEKKG
jgi:hypothetical protein